MHFICEKDILVKGVTTVQKAVSSRNSLPILSGVLVEAKEDIIQLSSTDLEMSIQHRIPARVEKQGRVVLPARYFSEITRRLPSCPICIEKLADSPNVRITYQQAEIYLHGMDPDQFPVFQQPEASTGYFLDAETLRRMIRQVSISAAHDEIRQIFNGILMEIKGNSITMVATDTHRLALKESILEVSEEAAPVSVVVPCRVLVEISHLIEEVEDYSFFIAGNQIIFNLPDLTLVSRLIEGQYPHYQQVIPSAFGTKVVAPTKKLLEVVERTSLMAREDAKMKSSMLKMKVREGLILFDSQSPEIGSIHEEMAAETEGKELDIIFNARYLNEVLRIIETEMVKIEFTGPLSACVLRPEASGTEGVNNQFLYLVLPIRIQ